MAWLADNADAAIGLTIAVAASILGIINAVPRTVIDNVTVLMLATLAFIALRDRHRAEASAGRTFRSVGETREEMRTLLGRSARALEEMPGAAQLAEWQDAAASMRTTLEHVSMVQVVPGAEVGHVHARARFGTERWVFKGGTGTYLRAVTLPQCVDSARSQGRAIKVQFEIVDPANRDLCARYANFRASLARGPDATGQTWTLDRTRKEAFATILAVCWHRQRYALLDVAGALSAVMSTFRMDMSSTHLIITQESRSRPALVVEKDKPHFRAYEQELQSSFEQARSIDLSRALHVPLADEPTIDEVRRLFTRLDLALPSTFTDQDVTDIVSKAIQPVNPYE